LPLQGAVLAEKDDEGKHAGIGGQHDGQQDQGREDGLAPLSVPCQDIGQGHAEHRGGGQHQGAQEQCIAESFQVVAVLEKAKVIGHSQTVAAGDFKALKNQKRQRIDHQEGNHRP
jgi:hypothetical protein